MRTLSSDNKISRLTADALFVATALIFSYVEAVFPLSPLPLPGFRAGLANIAILGACFRHSLWDGAAVSLCRIVLQFLLFANPTSFLFSLGGGVCVLLLLFLLKRPCFTRRCSFIGVSVLCAAAHNLGQILAGCLLLSTAVLAYLPALFAASLFYGTLSGILLNLLAPAILPNKKSNSKPNQ